MEDEADVGSAANSEPNNRFGASDDVDIQQLLSEKDSLNTKKSTKAAVSCFQQYLLATNRDLSYDTPEELSDVLGKFYADARKKDGTYYKLSAIKAIRFGLSRHFLQEMEVDIIKDPRFKKANDIFAAIIVRLKREGLGKIDHTPPIEEDDLKKLYGSIAVNTNTPVGLQQKVWFDLMYFLCRRGRENLRNMTKETFKIQKDSKGREYVFQVKDELDKNHREGETDQSVTEAFMYSVPGHFLCPVASYRKYLSKLHPERNDLWQRPVETYTESQEVWYNNQPLGKNTLAHLMKDISRQANLSQEYTNHSIRATSITVLDISKFNNRDIMSVSGHRSENSIKNYTGRVTTARKFEMSTALTASVINDIQGAEIQLAGELTLSQEQYDSLMEPMEEENINTCTSGATTTTTSETINSVNSCTKSNVHVSVLKPIENLPVQNVIQSETNTCQENVINNILKPMESLPFTPMISNCVVNFNINLGVGLNNSS